LAALWLAVVVCGFMFGWHAGRYCQPDPEDLARLDAAVRRHPAGGNMARVAMSDTAFHGDDLRYRALTEAPRRPGRFDLDDDPTSIDIARHWPALERNAGPVTTPISQVELSNWEANLRRNQRAWEHEHGIRDGQD
jgi:hypothetical protein